MRACGAGDRPAADGHGEGRRRRPDVRGQVGMLIVEAGVDDADDDASDPVEMSQADGARCPRRRSRRPPTLARIDHSPQLAEIRVVRSRPLCGDDVIGTAYNHSRKFRQRVHQLARVHVFRTEVDHVEIARVLSTYSS